MNTEKLKQAALKATWGRWYVFKTYSEPEIRTESDVFIVSFPLGSIDNASFIAAANPEPLNDSEFAIDMLELMFTAYENGVPCYEDPEDEVGFIGYAVRLADDDFKNIGDFLNRVRPVQTGIKEQG